MLDEIMNNERKKRQWNEPGDDLNKRYERKWKGLDGSPYEKWWREFEDRNP